MRCRACIDSHPTLNLLPPPLDVRRLMGVAQRRIMTDESFRGDRWSVPRHPEARSLRPRQIPVAIRNGISTTEREERS
jgi:hypothetical protein